MTNHQRVGAVSNAHARREFKALVSARCLGIEGWELQSKSS